MVMATNGGKMGLLATEGLELLTYGTPNGLKISILLEELKAAYGTSYTARTIDIFNGEQTREWYTSLAPSGHIPCIVDHDKGGYSVMEGVAIMNYLTRFYDPAYKFHFKDEDEACTAEQWLAWLHAEIGPYQAQANYFYRFNSTRQPLPTAHFITKVRALYAVLNTHLQSREYIAGPSPGHYSIVDMALFPFADAIAVAGIELEDFPAVLGWWERAGEREGVRKGVCVPSGKEFSFGYAKMRARRLEDPKGWEESEGPLRQTLWSGLEETRKAGDVD